MRMRDLGNKALPAQTSAAQPDHVGLRPGLVDEDEASDGKVRLALALEGARGGDVRAILLAGVARFFEGEPLLRHEALHAAIARRELVFARQDESDLLPRQVGFAGDPLEQPLSHLGQP